MIYKVEPWNDMEEDAAIPGITRSHTLHIWAQTRLSIQGLVLFDFINHFTHIHFNLSFVFIHPIESHCGDVSWGLGVN